MAASAATTLTIFTSSDETTQEYVQEELPLESRIPLVDEGEVAAVVKRNENDADQVHAIVPQTHPKFVIIQSNFNNRYLHLDKENASIPNALRFGGEYSFGPETRFEFVPATTGAGLVHIRCLSNNKYLAHIGTTYRWITAVAIKPEENQSDPNCTLFEPVLEVSNSNNRVGRLRHVNTGLFVNFYAAWSNLNFHGRLCLIPNINADMCTFIDWESAAVLPDRIRIKGDNGNHLKASGGEHGLMDFRSKADTSSLFDCEVHPSRNGGIRLKSVALDKYWTNTNGPSWVWLREDSSTLIHTTDTVFIPTIVDGNRNHILIQSLLDGMFCKRYTALDWESGLAKLSNYPDAWSYMEIEETVSSRDNQ